MYCTLLVLMTFEYLQIRNHLDISSVVLTDRLHVHLCFLLQMDLGNGPCLADPVHRFQAAQLLQSCSPLPLHGILNKLIIEQACCLHSELYIIIFYNVIIIAI